MRTLLVINVLVLMGGLFTPTQAATINVKTDRNPVSLNESFQIIFEAEGDLDGDPDFSPLENDFQVLSTVQSSNFSVVNGRISSSKRWTITAMANTDGNIAIPSIAFGQDNSPVMNLEVRGNNTGSSNSQVQNDIFLEASATPLNPYVQSQVIYTLKLYRSVAIAKASLAEPEIITGNAVLERIDDDKSYETTINGRNYHVIERNYSVYPQSSGEVSIAPINFMGQITRSRFGVDPFGAPPRTVVRRSQGINLNVQPIPASFSGNHWLPAENLNLAEEWSGDPMTLRVGEPITRTLILTARGLISSQLPELPDWSVGDLKFYPDRPQLDDEKSDAGISSIRREQAAIIPNQPGSYVLPEIAIPWWNTLTDQLETAIVPERIIRVLPATGADTGQPEITTLVAPVQPLLNGPAEDEVEITLTETPPVTDESQPEIWKWSTLLFVMIWIITLVAWWHKSGRSNARFSA
ncbi:MAG: protein BatD, partial [Gammaproteobacteria bacterium]|nr:protein BatD [Gammaproteobacteria bacterium]